MIRRSLYSFLKQSRVSSQPNWVLFIFLFTLMLNGCYKVKYTMTSPSKDVVVKIMEDCVGPDCAVLVRVISEGFESEPAWRTDCWIMFSTALWVPKSNVVVILVNNNYCHNVFMAYDVKAHRETALEPYVAAFENHLRREFRLSSTDLAEHRNSAIAWALDSQVGQEAKMRYRLDQ